MKHLSIFLVYIIASVHFTNAIPIPGEAGQALQFSGSSLGYWAEIGGTTLADLAGGSWTLDFWFKSSNPTAGTFQPVISHFSNGGLNNRHAGFNFQVWPNGLPCFFMGNGVGTNSGYGILIFGTNIEQRIIADQWYHVAIVFQGPDVHPYTPDSVTVYINGALLGTSTWNDGVSGPRGQRNIPSNRINLARFDNQDPGFQTFAGAIDEIRIWNFARTAIQVANGATVKPTSGTPGLLASYSFEETGLNFADATSNFPGLIRTYINGEQNPVFIPSGATIGTSLSVESGDTVIITLRAVPSSVTFFIGALPTSGTLRVVSSNGNIGSAITEATVMLALPSNRVAYTPNQGFIGFDTFTYFARDTVLSETAATVTIEVKQGSGEQPEPEPGCDGVPGHVYDSCGVCNGDDSTCLCIAGSYKSYSLIELDRILVHYNIQYTVDVIQKLESTLAETMVALFNTPATSTIRLGDAVDTIQSFNAQCLSDFISNMDEFLQDLKNAH